MTFSHSPHPYMRSEITLPEFTRSEITRSELPQPDRITEELFDVAVVGGGPAGLMAAIAARTQGARTVLVEKGDKLGRKLGISGGGRCNVTNLKPLPEFMNNIPGNPRFLYSALTQFGNLDIVEFVESLGIAVKEEDHGRVFPITDKAATVVNAFVEKVYELGVIVLKNAPVKRLIVQDGVTRGLLLRSGQRINARSVIVAAGGCSVPKTGSTGDAYPWAQKAGHTLVEPYPTAVPLTSDEAFIQKRLLQGLSFRDVEVTVWTKRRKKPLDSNSSHSNSSHSNSSHSNPSDATITRDKRLTTEQGDLLFTHLGLSGPAALRCSHYVSTSLRKHPENSLFVTIDFMVKWSRGEWTSEIDRARKNTPRRHIDNFLAAYLPERLVQVILQRLPLSNDLQLANISNQQVAAIVDMTKGFPVSITGTLPLAQATVTGGGISVKEINPNTMASKLCAGLFFAGEVMDVHAHTGGYNITIAFSTGHLAGISAAEFAAEAAAAPTSVSDSPIP